MEVVRFHLSGTEALIAAARLVRTNTGRPLLATFGSAAHGWTDGMAAEGVSLGEERYACDVINLRDMSAATLTLIRMRRDEIAAVLVNPIQGLATPPRERVPPPTVGGVPPPHSGRSAPPHSGRSAPPHSGLGHALERRLLRRGGAASRAGRHL